MPLSLGMLRSTSNGSIGFLGNNWFVYTACAPDIRSTRVEHTVAGLLLLCRRASNIATVMKE